MPASTMRPALRSALLFAAILISTPEHAFAASKPPAPVSIETAAPHVAEIDGIRVHYREAGKGRKAMIFVHGWCTDMRIWREQFAFFGAKYHVIAIDLPGHGASDKPHTIYSIPWLASVVAKTARAAGAREWVLVGHSLGVSIIREMYRQDPQPIGAMIAIDGAFRNPVPDEQRVKAVLDGLRSSDYRNAAARLLESLIGTNAPAAIREQVKESINATPQYVMVSALEGYFDKDLWRDDGILVPLLWIVPDRPGRDHAWQDVIKSVSPLATIITIPNSGHFVMLEQPARINNPIDELVLKENLLKWRWHR